MAAFFCRLTHHEGAKNGYFWGWKWACFCVFLPKNHLCTRPSEQPDMACDLLRRNPREPGGGGGGLAQHCCGVVAGSGNGGGCEGNWSALWSRSPRGLHARPVSTLGCVSATVCTHKRARKQVPAGARRSRNGVEGRLPRGGRGGEAGGEATLASCTTADQSLSQTASGVHRASCPLPGSRCRSP